MWRIFKSIHEEGPDTLALVEKMIEKIKTDEINCKKCAFVNREPGKYRVTSDKAVITIAEEIWKCFLMEEGSNQLHDFNACPLFKSRLSSFEPTEEF